MNLQQINEWRTAHGLTLIVATKTTRAAKLARDRNHAKRAAENRAIREARARGK